MISVLNFLGLLGNQADFVMSVIKETETKLDRK